MKKPVNVTCFDHAMFFMIFSRDAVLFELFCLDFLLSLPIRNSFEFGALRPKGRRFESYSSCHVGTLGKSFTLSCLPVG